MSISKKISQRIVTQLRRYQPILAAAKARDVSESDTVVIIGDMLADVLGYKKYIEITTESAVRGTFVDLAVKVDNEIRFLVETKAIGIQLKDLHVRQAVDYGANSGTECVVLTNGASWRFYKIEFEQPIQKTLLVEIDLLEGNIRGPETLEFFGCLSRECFTRDAISAFYQQQQVLSRYSLGALLLSDGVVAAIRREIRRIAPKLRVDDGRIRSILEHEVLKREIVEGEAAVAAQTSLVKMARKLAKSKAKMVSANGAEPGSDNSQMSQVPARPVETLA